MKSMRWKGWACVAGLALALSWAQESHAQSGDAILDLLIKKGVITRQEADEVREQLNTQSAQTAEKESKIKTASWIDQIKWYGDLRLRFEDFQLEDTRTSSGEPERSRFRARLRLGLEMKFQEWATIGVRLASGDGDPVSTNQSFLDTFRKKPISIDTAYVTIQPPFWDWVQVTGGKFDIPMWQPKFSSPMQYDFDLTLEGLAEQFNFRFGENDQYAVFANVGQFPVKEFSKDTHDALLFDFQGGISGKWGRDANKKPVLATVVGGGFYFSQNFGNFNYPVGDSSNLGNATKLVASGGKTNTVALADFEVVNARGEVAWMPSDQPFLGTPAVFTLSGEYIKNLASEFGDLPDDQTEGWTLQWQFGNAKRKGEWQVVYQYKYLEADATWDAVSASDWGDKGGTDRRGHVVKAAYNLLDWWQLGFAALITEKISDRSGGHNQAGIPGEEMLRLQIDSIWKY